MRRTIKNIEDAIKEVNVSMFFTLRDLADKVKDAGGALKQDDLTEEERKLIENYKEFLGSFGLELDDKGTLVVKTGDEEGKRKIRNFILKHPFMLLYIPDAEFFELMNTLAKNNFIELTPVVNLYGGVVYIVKPGNITPDGEIVKKIEALMDKKYPLGARLVDICSSIFQNGDEYELYFLDGSVFKFKESTFNEDIAKLNFIIEKPEKELKEIKMASTPLSKEGVDYNEAKESYYKLVEYLKSAVFGENSMVERFDSRFKLSRATVEGIFIDEKNGFIYFNKILIERALTSSGRALFDKNYARSILKSFFKFLGDFGIQEEISAGKIIYKISMEALK